LNRSAGLIVRIVFGRPGLAAAGATVGRMPRLTGNGAALGRACLCTVLAVLLAPSASARTTVTGSAGTGAARTLLHYGDSLSVGTGAYLGRFLPGWTVRESSGVSLHADEGPPALRALQDRLPRVIVISLGTNDDPGDASRFAGYVRDIVRIAGPRRCVIWSTIVRPPYHGVSYDDYNAVLRRAARAHPTLRLFDWERLARTHPQWFGPDGVHPTATGYRARAAALAKLVTRC